MPATHCFHLLHSHHQKPGFHFPAFYSRRGSPTEMPKVMDVPGINVPKCTGFQGISALSLLLFFRSLICRATVRSRLRRWNGTGAGYYTLQTCAAVSLSVLKGGLGRAGGRFPWQQLFFLFAPHRWCRWVDWWMRGWMDGWLVLPYVTSPNASSVWKITPFITFFKGEMSWKPSRW